MDLNTLWDFPLLSVGRVGLMNGIFHFKQILIERSLSKQWRQLKGRLIPKHL